MPYLTGLLSGFSARKAEIEAQNLDEARRAQEREGRIYETLINSPDKETRDLAIAGLLHSAEPSRRKGGLRGWLGELEQSPYLAQIRALSPDVTETQEIRGPAEMQGYIPTPPSTTGAAALPATSPTEVGVPPPTPLQSRIAQIETPTPITPDVRAATASRPVIGRETISRPRKVFRSPEEQQLLTEEAQARGQVRGRVAGRVEAGFTPEQARELERRQLTGQAGQTYGEGNIIPDPESPTGWSQELFLRADPTIRQRIPAQSPLTPEEAARRATAVTAARGTAEAAVPLNTQQRLQATTGLQDDWRKLEGPLREMQRQLRLMQTGLQRFRQGDKIGGSQAVLVTFQKILDPISVVRESEYARSPQGLSLMNRIEGYMQRLREGGAGVPDAELAGMVETANQFLRDMEGWNDRQRGVIEGTARDYGIDPARIFGAPIIGRPPSSPSGGAPAVGPAGYTVDDQGRLLLNGQPVP